LRGPLNINDVSVSSKGDGKEERIETGFLPLSSHDPVRVPEKFHPASVGVCPGDGSGCRM